MSPPTLQRRHFLARVLGFLAGGAWLGKAQAATTQQDDTYYLGEIRMFGGDFEPYGWRFCDGRLLIITDYDALFNLIGTTYGGDGQTTFALPDLRGRIPFHPSTTLSLGEAHGQESVTLSPTQAPVHSHNLQGNSGIGISDDPTGRVPAKNALGAPHYAADGDTSLASTTLVPAGGSEPHNNVMPSLCVNFIICIEGGLFPSQT
jgi:microcystin-dependent protein